MYEDRTGDLFAADTDAIAHGCNTVGVMGAGIAVAFKARWPNMFTEYKARCGDGRFTLGDFLVWGRDPVVYNLGTQPRPGRCADLHAIGVAVDAMVRHAEANGVRSIGVPRIGAGLGGLRWNDVRDVLVEAAGPSQVLVASYTPLR